MPLTVVGTCKGFIATKGTKRSQSITLCDLDRKDRVSPVKVRASDMLDMSHVSEG